MSYSFTVKTATKDEAKQEVLAKFDEVVASQPIHVRDRNAALVNAGAVIDLLADDDTKDVFVSCSGYVSWSSGGVSDAEFNSASISCSANHIARA